MKSHEMPYFQITVYRIVSNAMFSNLQNDSEHVIANYFTELGIVIAACFPEIGV